MQNKHNVQFLQEEVPLEQVGAVEVVAMARDGRGEDWNQ
jgi:hypothetical protein